MNVTQINFRYWLIILTCYSLNNGYLHLLLEKICVYYRYTFNISDNEEFERIRENFQL